MSKFYFLPCNEIPPLVSFQESSLYLDGFPILFWSLALDFYTTYFLVETSQEVVWLYFGRTAY